MRNMHHELRGVVFMIFSTLSAAAMILLSDYVFRLYPGISYAQVATWGNIVGCSIFALCMCTNAKQRAKMRYCVRSNGIPLLWCSVVTIIGALLFWYALSKVGSGAIAVLGKSEVLFSVLLGIVILQERLLPVHWCGMFIAVLGFVLFSRLDGSIPVVIAGAILLSRLCYAVQSMIIKKYTHNLEVIPFAFLRWCLGSVGILLYTIVLEGLQPIPVYAALLTAFGLLLNAALSKMLYFEAHKYLPISRLNFFILLTPVYILLGGVCWFGDHVTVIDWMGTIMVIVGLGSVSLNRQSTTG